VSTLANPPSSPTRKSDVESLESAKTRQPTFDAAPGRRHFLIRRLHSLLGLVFGGYITVHLLVNATALVPRDYQLNVDKIHQLEPMLWLIEIVAIFIPLLVHAIYGLYITKAGVKFNTTKYNYGGNVRYTLQRWTAVFLLLFIAFHIATLHRWGFHSLYKITHWSALSNYKEMSLFNPHNQAFQSTVSGIRTYWNHENVLHPGNLAVMAFYLLGVWSAVFHWANGLWTSAIAWGLTVTANSQRRWGHVCLGFGILMMIVGTLAWAAFTIAPAARGDTSRWDYGPNGTFTLPEHDTSHEQHKGEPDETTAQNTATQPAASTLPQ
jgi:succinate dehydrogenase / fumarate reductase cytochrome b subunit